MLVRIDVEAGTRIAGYRVLSVLGRGTGSLVVEAQPPGGGESVAIKLALDGGSMRDEVRRRFERGAHAQAGLDHPAIVRVVEVGVDARLGPFMVMGLVRGSSLAGLIAAGQLPAERAVAMLDQIAGALDHAHAAGVVHRDIKPSNVLVDVSAERAWLADFGLAREATDDGPTATGGLVGTLQFMAPEVIRGAVAGAAADRYAFAALAYTALVGEPVFPRPTDAAVLYAHTSDPPPQATTRRAELPPSVDAVLAGGLAKEPDQRPATAAALVDELRTALGTATTGLGSPPAGRLPDTATVTVAPLGEARSTRRFRRGLLLVATGAVALAAAIVTLDDDGGGGDTKSRPEAPVPPVSARFVALGATLTGDGVRSGDCDGKPPSGSSNACTIVQTALPGGRVVIPSDGAVRAWTVRGAKGELALQILRRNGSKIFQVARSQPELIPDTGPHRMRTDLAVEDGDVIGLALTPGTQVGRRSVAGARSERWVRPVGADRPPGTPGSGAELQVRVEHEPGGVPIPPKQVTGSDARELPEGREIGVSEVALPDGRRVRVALVVVDGAIHVDLFRAGQRRARIVVPDVEVGGQSIEFRAYRSPGNPSQLNVIWQNPGVTTRIEHYYGLGAESLEFYS